MQKVNEIISIINIEKAKLEQNKYTTNEYDYLTYFMKHANLTTYQTFDNGDIDLSDLLTAYFLSLNLPISFDEIVKIAIGIVDVAENEEWKTCDSILDATDDYLDEYNELFNLKTKTKNKTIEDFTKRFEKKLKKLCKSEIFNNHIDLIIKMIQVRQNDFINGLYYASIVKIIKNETKEITENIDKIPRKRRYIKDTFKEYKKDLINDIKYFSDIITSQYYSLDKEIKTQTKANNIKIHNYNKLIDILKNEYNSEEIKNIDKLRSLVSNGFVDYSLVKYIYEHNQEYYNVLENEYIDIKNNALADYIALYYSYNINLKLYNPESVIELTKISLKETSSILEIIRKQNLQDYAVDIISNSNTEIINEIYTLVNNGVISNKFIKRNINIYTPNVFQLLKTNLELLSNNNINIKKLLNNETILLMDNITLAKNIYLLNVYQLNISSKLDNIEFLKDQNLSNKIDLLIELNISLDDLSILNNSKQSLKKYWLLKNVLKSDDVSKLDGIEISDELIDDYILNQTEPFIDNTLNFNEINEIELPYLEQFIENSNLYNINGVNISIHKVKRNMKYLEDINMPLESKLLQSFINNSILSENDIEALKTAIRELNLQQKTL